MLDIVTIGVGHQLNAVSPYMPPSLRYFMRFRSLEFLVNAWYVKTRRSSDGRFQTPREYCSTSDCLFCAIRPILGLVC